ncbi:Thioredoxin domain-containing protein [Orchesella cincta]|uniref:Thioredoxin domain-containing protein n=1 Tax=Orchesella cincta TaxID=48709 RepID=A0A1D2N4R9_ORCCI|nr:Thioredoxin domain-containing protein [Orchesella cincta]
MLKSYGISLLCASLILILSTFIPETEARKLEKVSDDEFLKLIQTEKYVVTLFSKPGCTSCDEYEHELAMNREVLVDSLGAWVVKLVSSPLSKLYSPTLEPAVVFFRHGVPMLYHGSANEEEMLSKVQKCQDPTVKALNDETFEHLTQAATGATTGDWLVMFTRSTCVKSQRLQAVFEAAACELKFRVNAARVDKSTDGGATGRRFGVTDTPYFILFRHGKLYRYELDEINIQSLVDFATDFYRNSKAESVPIPKSPFDDFTEMIVEKMRENPQAVKLGSIVLSILIILGIFISFVGGKKKPATSSKKKDKDASKKKS